MDGPLAEVVARLKAAIEKLDTAAIAATRAQADAQQAQTHYREAGRGSGHSAINRAITESTTAADKAGKVCRLLAETSAHLTAYVNAIAPGTIQPGHATETGMPSGEELVRDTFARASSRPGVGALLSKMTSNVEDIQDGVETATESGQKIIDIFRHRHGPSGTHSASATTPPTPPVQPFAEIDAPEVASQLVVVGLVAGMLIHRTHMRFRKQIARRHADDHRDGANRPDPSDGST